MIILHTVTRGSGGGTMKSLKQSIDFERSLGHQVWICSGNLRNQDQNHIYISSLKRRINPFSDVHAFIQLARAVKKVNPDMMHSHESKAGILTRALSIKFKNKIYVHTVHMATFHSTGNTFLEFLYALIEKAMAKRTEYLLFVSPALKQIFENKNISAKRDSLVIRSRVNLELFRLRFETRSADRISVRELLQISEESICIIHVGLLEDRKRPDFILKSLAKVLKSQIDANLIFLGEGPMLSYLHELASTLGVSEKVHFAGFVDDTELWMSGSDVLVLASKFEGCPQVAIQAAAVGLPVIATHLEEYNGCEFIHNLQSDDLMGAAIEELIRERRFPKLVFDEELRNWSSDTINQQHAAFLVKVCNESIKGV